MNKFRLLVLCLFLVSCHSGVGKFVEGYKETQLFKQAADQKENEAALNHAALAQESLNGHFVTDSNLGIAFYLNQKMDQAEKSLLVALEDLNRIFPDKESPRHKEAEFILNYNLGVLYGVQMKVDEALRFYQRALDLEPNSKETKENIELLIQKQQQEQKGEGQKDPKDQPQQGQSQDQKKDGQKDQDQKDENQKDQKDENQKEGQDKKQTSKYKPRPFKGDELSEGDVKKILGELSNQDKKIRSQYEQKNRKEGRNEKDW